MQVLLVQMVEQVEQPLFQPRQQLTLVEEAVDQVQPRAEEDQVEQAAVEQVVLVKLLVLLEDVTLVVAAAVEQLVMPMEETVDQV
jgi:hypothetical protein